MCDLKNWIIPIGVTSLQFHMCVDQDRWKKTKIKRIRHLHADISYIVLKERIGRGPRG